MSASETGLLPGEIVKALVAYGEACAVNGYVCARKTTQPDEITKSLDGRVNTRASLEAAILAELNSRAPSPAASSDPGPCGCSVCTCGATDALALSHAALLAEVERCQTAVGDHYKRVREAEAEVTRLKQVIRDGRAAISDPPTRDKYLIKQRELRILAWADIARAALEQSK